MFSIYIVMFSINIVMFSINIVMFSIYIVMFSIYIMMFSIFKSSTSYECIIRYIVNISKLDLKVRYIINILVRSKYMTFSICCIYRIYKIDLNSSTLYKHELNMERKLLKVYTKVRNK